MKELHWLGTTRKRLKDFPAQARREAGEQLWRVQQGKEPTDWKSMKHIGPSAIEIRIHKPFEHGVIYVATFPEAIYVVHCFDKKTNQTTKKDIEIAKANYAKIQKVRRKS